MTDAVDAADGAATRLASVHTTLACMLAAQFGIYYLDFIAVHDAHDIISLQHDGIVFALRPNVAVADACDELEAACGEAVGYAIPVEKKDMSCDAAGPAPPVRPACGRHFGWGRGGGAGGGGVGRPSLVADRSRPLLPACRC